MTPPVAKRLFDLLAAGLALLLLWPLLLACIGKLFLMLTKTRL